jgi:hypothetical protein
VIRVTPDLEASFWKAKYSAYTPSIPLHFFMHWQTSGQKIFNFLASGAHAVAVNNSFFWHITLWSLEVSSDFGAIFRFHLRVH